MMAAFSSGTLLNTPRRMRLRVISAKKRSTILSQEADVGVKWRWKRLCDLSDRRGFVRGIVVDDEVQIEICRGALVDELEKPQEFSVPVTRHAFSDHLPVKHVERRKQRRSAVSLVVVRHGAGTALLHRQSGLSAVERLDLALLVHRQHQRLVGRIDVKAHDVFDLLYE